MNKFTMLASVAAVALSASAFAHDYKASKEVKSEVVTVASEAAPVSSDFYATVGAGYGKFKAADVKKSKPSFMIGFGKQIDNNMRADVTLEFNNKFTKDSVSYKSYAVMANAYYHLDDVSMVSPYATVGLGYAKQKLNEVKKGGIAFQVGAGVSAKMSDKVVLDLGYRFFKPTNVKIDGVKNKAQAHKIMAAIRLPL